jgi:apolipoprotein N-acyltransferase
VPRPASAFPLKKWPAIAFGAVSGALYFLGFPGLDAVIPGGRHLWIFAIIAFVPLCLALEGQTPKRATFIGLAAGATMNVLGFYWLLTMLRTFSGFPTVLCALFTLVVCAYQGGRFALMGWLFARAQARGWPGPVVFVLSFAASELLFPLLFPWYFGASVHDVYSLAQIAELGGPVLVGAVLVLANLAIAEPVMARMAARTLDRRLMVAGAAALAASVLYGVIRIGSVDKNVASAPAFRVGTVQANMGLFEKRSSFDEGLARHMRLTDELKAQGIDLVVWSETSVMRAERIASYKSNVRDAVGRRLGVPSIIGAVLFDRVPGPRQVVMYNSALSTNARGDVTARYDKEYLLMFGEYLPFGDAIPVLYEWSPNSGKFSPGTQLDPLVIVDGTGASHAVTTLICYEDILPGFTRAAVNAAGGASELLVNMTNDAWFGDSTEPWEHLALAQLRAIEHRRYLVRSTNSGVSAIVDPVGRVLSHTSPFREETLRETIHWMRGSTLYELIGDYPAWIGSAAIVFMAFRPRRRRLVDVVKRSTVASK